MSLKLSHKLSLQQGAKSAAYSPMSKKEVDEFCNNTIQSIMGGVNEFNPEGDFQDMRLNDQIQNKQRAEENELYIEELRTQMVNAPSAISIWIQLIFLLAVEATTYVGLFYSIGFPFPNYIPLAIGSVVCTSFVIKLINDDDNKGGENEA